MDVARDRLRAQALVTPLASAAEVVSHLLAVQAQDLANARWAIGQRARNATDADVERAYDAGEILRTHVMRPTWHFVAPADIRWLLALTAPRVHALSAPYYKKTGLTAAKLTASDTAIARALAGTTLTRDELAVQAGLGLVGTPLAYAAMHAELEGVIASGPRRGKHTTYALLDERAPATPARTREDALTELARRYVTSHGPATAKDLAWWSGLSVADARRGLELANIACTEGYFHVPREGRAVPDQHVRLLPNYDELVVAFHDRSALGTADKDVIFHHSITSQGRLIGNYRRVLERKTTVVQAALLGNPSKAERTALAAEVERLGRFLATPIRLDLATAPR